MKKARHSDLTTNQVREKLFISFCIVLITLGIILFYGSISIPKANADRIENVVEEQVDENLTNSTPTPRWRLNSNGYSQRYVHLEGTTLNGRAIELLEAYDFDGVQARAMMKELEKEHKIKAEMFICVAYADSSLGKFLKTDHNYGNVGNTDSGKTQAFNSMKQGFDAIARYALNGKYLKHKYTIDYLSPAYGKPGPYYATSKENWNVNILNCLGILHNKNIEPNWVFRI